MICIETIFKSTIHTIIVHDFIRFIYKLIVYVQFVLYDSYKIQLFIYYSYQTHPLQYMIFIAVNLLYMIHTIRIHVQYPPHRPI
jgi:hypothetical protein